FSSRRRHTRFSRDWSSDVCSSDLLIGTMGGRKAEIDLGRLLVKRQELIGSVLRPRPADEKAEIIARFREAVMPLFAERRIVPLRSEERRVGEEGRARWTGRAEQHS